MEDWEEGSTEESCRSSVISDVDDLEASLYGIVHHEVNQECDQNFSQALSVLPDSEETWRTKGNEAGVANSGTVNSQNEEFREENKSCDDKKEKEVSLQGDYGSKKEKEEDQRSVNQESAQSFKHHLSNEVEDSRYNIGCASHYSNDNTKIASSNTLKTNSEFHPQSEREPSPVVIDILSSEEEQEVHPINNHNNAKKKVMDEVVVLDNSDSDVMIEIEKVNTRQNKRKKKSDDLLINTENSCKTKRFQQMCDPSFMRSNDANSSMPAPMTNLTPMKVRDLSTLCKSWTPEMINFYEDSWGGEHRSLYDILSPMSDHGWHLDVEDQFSILTGRSSDRRYFGNAKARCTNCNRRGHFRNECTEVIRQPKCHRCGSADHNEYRCDEKICLTCGKETKFFTKACRSCRSCLDRGNKCSICSLKGHISKSCPDLWRRYHATVVPGHVVRPKKVLYKSSMNLYCCNCATRGHHVYQCKKKIFSDYIPQSPIVIKYENPPSESLESERLGISENWDRKRIAHENKIKETPRKAKDSRKTVSKLKISPTIDRSGKAVSDKIRKTPIKPQNSTPNVSTSINAKENKVDKKKKINQSEDQQNLDINASKTPCAKQPASMDEAGSIKNSGKKEPTNNVKQNNVLNQLASTKHSKMMLSNKQYQMLASEQGNIVLKHLSKIEPGTAVTLLHSGVKMLIFMGTKKGRARANNFIFRALRSDKVWKKIVASISENDSSKVNNEMKPLQVQVMKTSNNCNDLVVKFENQSGNVSRKVTHLPIPAGDDSNGPKNNVVKIKENKIRPKKPKQRKKSDPIAKSIIMVAVRQLVTGSEYTIPGKVKSFSQWALHNYGPAVSAGILHNLKILNQLKESRTTTDYVKKVLYNIVKCR